MRSYVHQHSIVCGFVLRIRGIDLKVLDSGDAADGLPLMLHTLVAAGTGSVGSHSADKEPLDLPIGLMVKMMSMMREEKGRKSAQRRDSRIYGRI